MINRLTKLRKKMKERGFDGVLIFNPVNFRYISGFTGDAGCIMITQNKEILITDSRYVEQARTQTKLEVIEHTASIYDKIDETAVNLGLDRIYVDETYITCSQYMKLKERLDVGLKPDEGIIEELRMIKDKAEIDDIRSAVKIGEKSLEKVLDIIKPEVTEFDVAIELEYIMKKNGAQAVSFDTIVLFGADTSLPHGQPSNKKLKSGDFVLIDFGCKVNGYCSDMTRTFVLGKPSEEQKKIYDIVLQAQLKALESIEKYKKCRDIDKIARDYITEKGYGTNFGHGLGHSVGLNIHENPMFSSRDDTILKTGMILTVEPGIYIEGFGGVRIEDMVIIKDNGIENLMQFSKDLINL